MLGDGYIVIKCNFCGKELDDDTEICDSCGSKDFSNICNKCGTVFDSSFCPACGVKAGELPKICPNCGNESFDIFCSKCGTELCENNISVNDISDKEPYQSYRPKKKSKLMGLLIFVMLVIIYIALKYINNETNNSNDQTTDKSVKPTSEVSTNNTNETYKIINQIQVYDNAETNTEYTSEYESESVIGTYQTKLSAGNYVAGVDFPSGKYNITAVSGSGNVMTVNTSEVNEIMGTDKDDDNIKIYKNANLKKGVILQVCDNLVIRISSKNANLSERKKRKNKLKKTIKISSGHYIAGTDFPAGTYDVIAVKGSGNVISSNDDDLDINEIMTNKKDDDPNYIKKYKNAVFDKGDDLKISGVTIKLVPSKAKK